MADDDIETEDMVILTVCTQYFGERSSSSSDEYSEDSNLNAESTRGIPGCRNSKQCQQMNQF
jgi:hypothetical protein